MPKTLTITATPQGEITVEAHGYHGKGCEAATKFMETALGTVRERKLKPEHAQVVSTTATRHYQNQNA